jgi:hypothetical protein
VLAPAAVLTAIDPPLVTLGSDDTVVTLRGRGFAAGATVYVDGNPWTVSRIAVVDSSTIRVPLPKSFFSAESSWAFAVQNPNSDRSNILPFGR